MVEEGCEPSAVVVNTDDASRALNACYGQGELAPGQAEKGYFMSQRNDRAARVVRGLRLMTLGLAALIAFPAQAPAEMAMTGTLTDYEAGGKYNGSTIGNYTVAVTSFSPLNSGITADNITVTPVSIGLQFTLPNFAGTMNGTSLEIAWTITDSGGAASITNAALAMTNVTVNGTGLATITDQAVGLRTSLGSGTNMPQDLKSFSPVSSVSFDDRLSAQIGFQAGQAQITTYTEVINVPEPSTFVPALIGALGVATLVSYDWRRRTPR